MRSSPPEILFHQAKMALPTAYLTSAKRLNEFFNAIISAQAPTRFTQKFLENLGFKSSSDRLFIGILKALGFLDGNNAPTSVYYSFLDQTESKKILAKQILLAYSDLFQLNKSANEFSSTEVKSKFKSLTEGQKTDNVLSYIVTTFTKLVEYADWSDTEDMNI